MKVLDKSTASLSAAILVLSYVYSKQPIQTYYDAYKEALNAATNEVRKSKRNFEHKLAQNIKSDSRVSMRMYEVSRMFEIRVAHWRTMLGIK